MNDFLAAATIVAVLWWLFFWLPSPKGKAWVQGAVELDRQRRAAPLSARCPTCGSSAVQVVRAAERLASGLAGGLVFSRKARAHFRCTICRYYW